MRGDAREAGQAPPEAPLPAPLLRALDRRLGRRRRIVLAVSGGLDSMVLLHAVAAWRPPGLRVLAATFDHGTGEAAAAAVRLVRSEARRLGIRVVAGRARSAGRTEAEWREQRWRFLHRVARRERATVATAHTRDDQVETVVLRILRGSGARGLAGLLAPSPVARPWLDVTRALLEAVAAARGIPHVEDPSNLDPRHLRNRVRHSLLPAMRRLRPAVDGEMLDVGRRAAGWRRAVERVVDRLGVAPAAEGGVRVARGRLRGYSPEELATVWPAIAARAGVRLDRRGTSRVAAFSSRGGARVARIPLSDGAELVALPDRFVVRQRRAGATGERTLDGLLRLDGWRFRPRAAAVTGDEWQAGFPAGRVLTVRGWRAGDRIRAGGGGAARRVKRFLAEAGIPGPLREGWPVVLLEGEIVWIPGVCRSGAATVRPGRPAVYYQCDRIGS